MGGEEKQKRVYSGFASGAKPPQLCIQWYGGYPYVHSNAASIKKTLNRKSILNNTITLPASVLMFTCAVTPTPPRGSPVYGPLGRSTCADTRCVNTTCSNGLFLEPLYPMIWKNPRLQNETNSGVPLVFLAPPPFV